MVPLAPEKVTAKIRSRLSRSRWMSRPSSLAHTAALKPKVMGRA